MLRINEVSQLYLGIQGENQGRTITIDVSDWLVDHPNGSVTIWHRRSGDTVPTATGAEMDTEAGTVSWSPSNVDTYYAGEGLAEIRLTENDVIKKSKGIVTYVEDAVTQSGQTEGSDWQSYIDAVDRIRASAVAAKNDSENAAQHPPYINQATMRWMIWDMEAEEYTDSGISAQPAATVPCEGVPAGGLSGAILRKMSGDDYDTGWEAPANNLTETSAGKVLDARQGKTIADVIGANEYDHTDTYAVGDPCIHGGELMWCTTPISTPEEWTAAHWTSNSVLGKIADAMEALGRVNPQNISWLSNVDANDYKTTGMYGLSTGCSNVMSQNWCILYVYAPRWDILYQTLACDSGFYWRMYNVNLTPNWKSWRKINDESYIAIVTNGNTAPIAISQGKYVIWNAGLYIAKVAISSGATLSTSNLDAVAEGGLNATTAVTHGQISTGITYQRSGRVVTIHINGTAVTASTGWATLETIPNSVGPSRYSIHFKAVDGDDLRISGYTISYRGQSTQIYGCMTYVADY